MKTQIANPLLLATLVALSCLWGGAAVQAATPVVHATVEGSLAPGVYGRIDIGTAPPPPLIYAQPIVIYRSPVVVQQQPLYLHVPPGHAKKWSKHCAKYNACGQPVYFVRVNGDDDYERRGGNDRHEDKHEGKGKGHDKGHGKGDDDSHGKGKHER